MYAGIHWLEVFLYEYTEEKHFLACYAINFQQKQEKIKLIVKKMRKENNPGIL